MAYTNGCEGFIALARCAYRPAVSRYISIKIRGRVLGKLGSLHVPESGPSERYATCDLWSAESVFLPSQHEGKLICARMPEGHSCAGSSLVRECGSDSCAIWGVSPKGDSPHVADADAPALPGQGNRSLAVTACWQFSAERDRVSDAWRLRPRVLSAVYGECVLC
jgi:hypothetical protein